MILSIRIVMLGHPVYRKDAPTCRQTVVHEAVEVWFVAGVDYQSKALLFLQVS